MPVKSRRFRNCQVHKRTASRTLQSAPVGALIEFADHTYLMEKYKEDIEQIKASL
jgi:hypothetical protein